MGWALGSVVAASDRDIEHAAKLFDGMFVFMAATRMKGSVAMTLCSVAFAGAAGPKRSLR